MEDDIIHWEATQEVAKKMPVMKWNADEERFWQRYAPALFTHKAGLHCVYRCCK